MPRDNFCAIGHKNYDRVFGKTCGNCGNRSVIFAFVEGIQENCLIDGMDIKNYDKCKFNPSRWKERGRHE